MLDIGFSEILLVFVIALIVLGPEKLPRVAAQVGKWVGRARAMARQFREQLEEEVNVEAARKKQTAEEAAPKSQPSDATQGAGSATADNTTGTTAPPPPSDTSAHMQAADTAANVDGTSPQEPHLDLTDQPWPYVAPAPPPEVADVFHDLLRPTAPASGGSAAAAKPPGSAASAAPVAPEAEPAQQVLWPHDHDVPSPSPETTNEKALEGAQSATHERGT